MGIQRLVRDSSQGSASALPKIQEFDAPSGAGKMPMIKNAFFVLSLLGVASLAAFVLQFFHHFDVTAIDLSLHMAAVMFVVAVAGVSRRVLA